MTHARPPVLALFEHRDGVNYVTLNRPSRGNAIIPALLDDLAAALAEAAKSGGPLVLTGQGRAFSTGGDIAGFLDHAGDSQTLRQYASEMVGALNDILLTLRDHPGTVIAAVNGPVTGGSMGFVLAADRVLICEHAFAQPYYASIGFAPDGGWTALLPLRIGAARAAGWIASDARLDAKQLHRIGLADRLLPPADLMPAACAEAGAARWLDPEVILQARRDCGLDPVRLAEGLEAERQAFLRHVIRPETRDRMTTFVESGRKAG